MFSLEGFQLFSKNLIQKSIHHINFDSVHTQKLFAHAAGTSMMQGIWDVKPICHCSFRMSRQKRGKSLVYTLELSHKFDFQHSTRKLDNKGYPTIETG